jgi:hypothetical protein
VEEELEGVLRASGLEERVTQMLRVMAFNPLEWQQYAQWDHEHFTRVLLASSPYYSLVLSCWDRGQFSPPHDHAASRNWIKVLEGETMFFSLKCTRVGLNLRLRIFWTKQEKSTNSSTNTPTVGQRTARRLLWSRVLAY